MRYSVGLDIGIASVGYCAMELDEDDLPLRIIRVGTRIFDKAENPKDGAPLAVPRREARSARRRIRRKSHRKDRIRKLIISQNILSTEQLDALYENVVLDIYQIRSEALDRLITNEELARILIHIAQRRGFQSNRKKVSTKEDGALLSAIAENAAQMKKQGYRTVGELLYRDERYREHKRNKAENYLNTVSREMVCDEVCKIFLQQRELGNNCCSKEFEEAYLKILLSQRSFEEGPGHGNENSPSPYAGDQIEKMVGLCTFEGEQGEKRAPKASYSFERFELLQKVNHIRLDINGKSVPLTPDQRLRLIELAHIMPNLTYSHIRKELSIPEGVRFNMIRKYEKDVDSAEKNEKFNCLKSYHEMRKAFDKVSKNRIMQVSVAERNEIAKIFTLYKSEAKLKDALSEMLEPQEVEVLIDNLGTFQKFGHLSIKALDKINTFLEVGQNYSDACESAGYDFKGRSVDAAKKIIYLSHLAEMTERTITSLVARRALSQCAKVINAVIREIDESPVFINIELARETAKPYEERKKADKGMKENSAHNERLKTRISEEFGKVNPAGLDIVKLKLYEAQGGICPYSVTQLDITRIFEPGYVDIDHIVPYSISFDDSYRNKVLVRTNENRQKGNRLPLQYMTGERRDKFIVWVNNVHLPAAKKRLLLKEEITDLELAEFKERNIQDTKTISSFMHRYLSDYLTFSPFVSGRKRHVTAVNGAVTSMLRKRWGLTKVREDGDLHHAIDAAVVACTTQAMINKLSGYYERRETFWDEGGKEYEVSKKTGELRERFPQPYEQFSDELIARLSSDPQSAIGGLNLNTYNDEALQKLSPVFVSRMPSRKVSGAAHKETIKGIATDSSPIKKVTLTALSLDKDNEIKDYYNPNDDRLLYNALRERLIAFDGKADKAFAESFYKPKSDGMPGPLVKKVKIFEKSTLNVLVRGEKGVADNDSMVRVDVFHVEGEGYYLVPIYVADTVKDTLPNKAIVAFKPYDEWKEMSDDNFIFSLYPNDLIHVKAKKSLTFSKVSKENKLPEKSEKDDAIVYYKGTDISVGAMTVINHDNSYTIKSLGAKTLQVFEKYQVDILGNLSKIGREKRQDFSQMRR